MTKLTEIRNIACNNGWAEIDHQENIFMISFHKVINDVGVRINVYYTTMTVSTALKHPTKGKTQLFRKNVSLPLLGKLFINPRLHTEKGYYNK
jgi:hypothetical protein